MNKDLDVLWKLDRGNSVVSIVREDYNIADGTIGDFDIEHEAVAQHIVDLHNAYVRMSGLYSDAQRSPFDVIAMVIYFIFLYCAIEGDQ